MIILRLKILKKLYSENENFKKFIHDNSEKIFRENNAELSLSSKEEEKLNKGEIVKFTKGRDYYLFKNSNGVVCQLITLKAALGDTDDFIPKYGLRKNSWRLVEGLL